MGTLVHEKSCQSVKSDLDLFALPSTQNSLEHGHYVGHQPQYVLVDGVPVKFNMCEEREYYIDLSNLFLHTCASVVNENSENLNDDSVVAPVSNFLHSSWSQIDLSFYNRLVSHSNSRYPYRAYLETSLCCGPAAKNLICWPAYGSKIRLTNLTRLVRTTQATQSAKL